MQRDSGNGIDTLPIIKSNLGYKHISAEMDCRDSLIPPCVLASSLELHVIQPHDSKPTYYNDP